MYVVSLSSLERVPTNHIFQRFTCSVKQTTQTQMRFSKNALRKHNAKRGNKSIYNVAILISLLFLAAFFLGFLIGIYLLETETTHRTYLNYTLPEIEEYFECDEVFATTRPIWTAEQWREVRDFYRHFAEDNHFGTYQIAKDRVFDSSELAVPFQAGEEKGRGLMAARDIQEGEIVIRSSNNTIVFDPLTFRKFLLEAEGLFPTFACDALIWHWLQDLDDGEKIGIVLDLNDNNLLNNVDEETDANLYCGTPGEEDSCLEDLQFYAARDIASGEELVVEYSDFVSPEATW